MKKSELALLCYGSDLNRSSWFQLEKNPDIYGSFDSGRFLVRSS